MSSLILLHEEAISISHPVFQATPSGSKAIFIWDDEYFIEANYSFKRLVFIYESICQLPIDVIKGNLVDVIKEMHPTIIYIPATNNPLLLKNIDILNKLFNIKIVEDEQLIGNGLINRDKCVKRFFQYWKNAEKTIFKINGQNNA
jgi:hypothetical protein